CNTLFGGDCSITNFLEEHCSPEDILKWNDEFINNIIDGCRPVYNNNSWEAIKSTSLNIKKACKVFTKEQATYLRIIEVVKAYYAAYGYFMNYHFHRFLSNGMEDKSFRVFHQIYLIPKVFYEDTAPAVFSHGDERRYITDDGYKGLIKRLYYLGYTDILNKLFTELILPVFNHYTEFENNNITALMSKNNIVYDVYGDLSIKNYSLWYMIKNYAKDNNMQLPDGIKQYIND
ncbi:MAG: hypothetical protein LUD19_05100, partial [Clostridia bacterium]|nr:hypothetical protein [Clostridia bacterium]